MYFRQAGSLNIANTIELALQRARELGINEIVAPSNTGATAHAILDAALGAFEIVIVTSHAGFSEPFAKHMSDEVQAQITARGAKVVRGGHALSGVERSLSQKYGGTYPALIMADTLRLFGQGTKVSVEIAVMAADAGALSGNKIIALGGTHHGVDTALVLTPAHMNNFFDLQIHGVICKPFNF